MTNLKLILAEIIPADASRELIIPNITRLSRSVVIQIPIEIKFQLEATGNRGVLRRITARYPRL